MRTNALDLILQVVGILVLGLAALITGAIGIYIEYQSSVFVAAGEYSLGVWIGLIGLVFLGFSFLIFKQRILPAIGY